MAKRCSSGAASCLTTCAKASRNSNFSPIQPREKFAISTTEPMAAGLVPAVVDRVSRQYPRLVINVLQAATVPLQYAALRERKVDLILGRMVTPIPDEDVNLEILFMDPFRVVAGANNRWARRRKVVLVDLAEEPGPCRSGTAGSGRPSSRHCAHLA